MNMTAAQSFDSSSPFALKQEKDDCVKDKTKDKEDADNNGENVNDEDEDEDDDEDDDDDDDDEDDDDDDEDEDDEENDDDAKGVSPLAQPSILEKDSFEFADSKDEFLRLTSMVRRVYFSYLHKSIIGNYNVCCLTKDKKIPKSELKKFASQMELCAVKASLEASLYRQRMLRMISDMKSSTSSKRAHKKLSMFLEKPPNRADAAVQTCDDSIIGAGPPYASGKSKDVNIQSAFVTSNFDENLIRTETKNESEKNLDDRITELLKNDKKTKTVIKLKREKSVRDNSSARFKDKKNIASLSKITSEKPRKNVSPLTMSSSRSNDVTNNRAKEMSENRPTNDDDIFDNDETIIAEPLKNDDDCSQDSLMQHLEDMFCESDDSSDLMTLIEKHSGVTKANVDSEIGKMCLIDEDDDIAKKLNRLQSSSSSKQPLMTNEKTKLATDDKTDDSTTSSGNKRKLSFTNYKRMKKRAMGEPETPPHEETPEERQNRKIRGIWFVERVHQVRKLEARMMELSVNNYRKHGRMCAKFIELFGDPDDEDTMPQSPIKIEEHLTACKERIAPWVVKYLMPYYTKGVIKDRLLFKAVAKHIADMLIIENTFPEEDCVRTYVEDYFRNRTSIKTESDVYM